MPAFGKNAQRELRTLLRLMKPITLLSAMAAGLLILSGCTTTQVSSNPYTSRGHGQSLEQNGLLIEVECVTDQAKLKELFGTANLGKNTLAIHVLATNSNPAKTFIVQPESFHLGTAPSGTKDYTTTGQVMTITGNPLLIGLFMLQHGTTVQHNLLTHQFKSATLQNGDSTAGFLFFRPTEGGGSPLPLEAAVSEAGSPCQIKYQFNLKP